MRLVSVLLVGVPLVLQASSALAKGDKADPAASASAAASAEAPAPSGSASAPSGPGALAELPRLQPITYPEPDPGAVKELDRLLERLISEDDRSRADARKAINELGPSLVPAVRARVQELRKSIDREAAPRLLEGARKVGRKSLESQGEGKKKPRKKKDKERDDDEGEGDWLDFMLQAPKPKDKDWQDLTRLLALERALVAIGTTPAVRELIAFRAYFGEMLRIDLQRQIKKLGDKAVPALIEARKHDAEVVQKFANKELDALGRAIPGEAVASNDTQILADVLRAYGRVRDADAERVLLSFTNNDRVQIRDAAREAIAAIGEPGMWQLKDQYLGLTGEKPPRGWSWDRLAREIFAIHDKGRLTEVYKAMDDGVAAAKAGKVVEAVEAYDRVLARAPLFERRKEMAPTFFERGKQLEEEKKDEALATIRKALRLDPKGAQAKAMEAEIAYLEGVISVDQGAPDKTAFTRALDLDPAHDRARKALAALDEKVVERKEQRNHYFAAGAIGLVALLLMVVLGWPRKKLKMPPPTPRKPAEPVKLEEPPPPPPPPVDGPGTAQAT